MGQEIGQQSDIRRDSYAPSAVLQNRDQAVACSGATADQIQKREVRSQDIQGYVSGRVDGDHQCQAGSS